MLEAQGSKASAARHIDLRDPEGSMYSYSIYIGPIVPI